MKKEIIEYCSTCEEEAIIQWDTETCGFETICPHCGSKLLLCSECTSTPCKDGKIHACDWDRKKHSCFRMRADAMDASVQHYQLQEAAYRRFQLWWMISHGITIPDLFELYSSYWGTVEADSYDNGFEMYIEEKGFNGELWPCKEEFLDHEFRNQDLMRLILSEEQYTLYEVFYGKD